MKSIFLRFSLILLVLSFLIPTVKGNITLPSVFSDNMVLQQKSEITIWGWAKTGETVSLKADWMNSDIKAKADNQGMWKLNFNTPEAGGPYNIRLKGYNEVVLKNVLIGEVWLCSGQSNMEWTSSAGIINTEEEIKSANFPKIRFFNVNYSTALCQQNNCIGQWTECTPETMKGFSAIGYFFAKKLQQELGIPVGVVNSSWGGTPAEAWMPEESILTDPVIKEAAAKQKPVPWGPVEPGRIYNSMIAPITLFRIAGVLWYQGEANTVNANSYQAILTGLIKSWRAKWGYDFPFYFAQIAPYKYGDNFDGVTVRDQQRRTLSLANTGMVVLSDIGDTTNIHPKNKQGAALRFANLALNRVYNKPNEDSGPLFKSMSVEKGKAIISFDFAEGLYAKGEKGAKLSCFEIAGDDKVYYPADAKIVGGQVVLQSKLVKTPAFARFAWGNTATPNLFNGANLPASCFTTEY
jgi:sialate O-acetylesterase